MKNCRYILVFICIFTGLWSVKLSAQVPIWSKVYGNGPYSYGKGIIEDDGGSFFVLGNTGSSSNSKIEILKIDSLGAIVWEKIIGDNANYVAEGFSRTYDKGLIIAGYTNKNLISSYDVLVIKTDSNANILWEKTYGGSDWDMAHAVLALPDSTYIVTGETYSFGYGSNDVYTLRLDKAGDTLWTKVFGGDSSDFATCLDISPDSTIIIGANTSSSGAGSYDGLVIKMDLSGDTVWTQIFGDSLEERINTIKAMPDSGFIFGGSKMNYAKVYRESWIVHCDKNRNVILYTPVSAQPTTGESVVAGITIDNNKQFVFAGYTSAYGNGLKDCVFTLTMEHFFWWKCGYTFGSSWDEEFRYAIQTRDSGYIAVGSSAGFWPSLSGILVVKSGKNCENDSIAQHVASTENITAPGNIQFSVWPTVSDGLFFIHSNMNESPGLQYIQIYDASGRLVKAIAPLSEIIDLQDQPSGLYFIRLSDEKSSSGFKVILQKQ